MAIVLVDPTVREGFPLWRGHANWLPAPSPRDAVNIPVPIVGDTLFKTIHQATLSYPWFQDSAPVSANIQTAFVKPALCAMCAEWHVLCRYLRTRLSQVEWDFTTGRSYHGGSKVEIYDQAMSRLETWRRYLPKLRNMVTDTLEQALPAAARLATSSDLRHITADFQRILRILNEHQFHLDRLTSFMTSDISIEEARRGQQENKNLARLSWPTTIFLPLTFVSGLFSMQGDLATLKSTFGWYFAAALPLALLIVVVAKKGRVASDVDRIVSAIGRWTSHSKGNTVLPLHKKK